MDEDLDWRAPKGKINVQVLATGMFLIAVASITAGVIWGVVLLMR